MCWDMASSATRSLVLTKSHFWHRYLKKRVLAVRYEMLIMAAENG